MNITEKGKLITVHELKQIKREKGLGYFYIIEYGNGVKIGNTDNPYNRYKTIEHLALHYGDTAIGRMFLSYAHSNYIQNERLLHKHFSYCRLYGDKSERFDIKFDETINSLPDIKLKSQIEEEYDERKMRETAKFFWRITNNTAGLELIDKLEKIEIEEGIVDLLEELNIKAEQIRGAKSLDDVRAVILERINAQTYPS